MSFYDLNDAPEQRPDGVIPDGTYTAIKMALRPGGENVAGCSEHDLGLFKQSLTSDVAYLDAELTVITGPHKGRKFWQKFTVAGGRVGEGGVSKGWNITKVHFRGIVDSAFGLDPKDMSDAAKARRALRGFRDLDGIEFFAKIGVEHDDNGTYPDKNKIAHVVVPGEPQYAALKAGKEVAPAPSAAKSVAPRQAPTQQSKPAWQQDPLGATQPAAATPGPAWLKREKK
jgi:hypothetical protein